MNILPPNKDAFALFGAGRSDSRALAVGAAAHHALRCYAEEVVVAFGLCPYLNNLETGLGKVGVVLDREPDVDTALAALVELGGPVAHLIYPNTTLSAAAFERFGSNVAAAVDVQRLANLVHAAFHPEMSGGFENAYRLVGVLRRAPHPFLQFIPNGFKTGGTVVMGQPTPPVGAAEARFARLTQADLAELTSRIAECKRSAARDWPIAVLSTEP